MAQVTETIPDWSEDFEVGSECWLGAAVAGAVIQISEAKDNQDSNIPSSCVPDNRLSYYLNCDHRVWIYISALAVEFF